MKNSGTWIDWQYLLKAAELLMKVNERRILSSLLSWTVNLALMLDGCFPALQQKWSEECINISAVAR